MRDPEKALAAAALVATACVVSVLCFTPARSAVNRFLALFRVQRFSAVTIDQEHLDKLQKLGDSLRSGLPAEAVFDRKEGEPQKVADAAEASRLAGFAVRMPQNLPAAACTGFTVTRGPAVHYQFNREKITAELQEAGFAGITLPPLPSGTIRVDVPAIAVLGYQIPAPSGKDTTRVRVIQVANPTVTLPPGTDAVALGETMLQILGMSASDARKMGESIDWTNTLVVPIPKDLAGFREVEVDGVKGLLLEESRRARRHGEGAALLWERGDVVYSVQGEHILPSGLLEIAQSLR